MALVCNCIDDSCYSHNRIAMKPLTWNDVNVFQWQQLIALFTEDGNTELDLIVRAGSILLNKTEHEIDSMPYHDIVNLGNAMKFIHTEIEPKPARYIKANGKRYRCVYDVRHMPAARYIESKHFSTDVNGNLHRIAASMVIPQRRRLGFWVDDKYDASKHSDYAQDMLAAPITSVLGSVVFFCEVFLKSMGTFRDFMVLNKVRTLGMTKAQAEEEWDNLWVATDGTIRPNWLQGWRGLNYKKPTN
jgi:hypothetical protein